MDKQIVGLSNWTLKSMHDFYYLTGIADKHPKLGTNVNISHTSEILKAVLAEDILECETHNTIYKCPLKFMLEQYSEETLNLIKTLTNCDIDFKNQEFRLHLNKLLVTGKEEKAKEEETENERLIDEAMKYEDSLYIEVSTISQGNKAAYNIKGETGIIEPIVHVGTFQDSILYMKDNIDFRYFPNWDSIRIYNWSDDIKNVVIKNKKAYVIYITNDRIVHPDEIEILDKSKYDCESLFNVVVKDNDDM